MKKTKKFLSLLLTVFMLLSIVPMSDRGIEASAAATNDYTSWKQYDSAWNQVEAWPKSQFPNAQYRLMSEAGCLVTSIAILLRHHNVVTDNNVNNFNPWICNEALKKVGAFTNAADLYYGRVAWAYPDFVYQGSIPYSYANIKSLYEQGFACVIKVYNWHFVALNNVSGNTVNIFDPGSSSRNTIASFSNPLEIFYYKANSNSTPSVQEPTKIVYPTDGGIYKIAAGVGNNMYLDFACTNTNVQIYENCDGHSNPDFVKSQYYKLTHVGDGWYTVVNPANGKAMDVYDWRTASGTNIQQWDLHSGDCQLFRFYDAGDGYCYIKSKLGTYVDVQDGNNVSNTNVWAYSFNGSNAQKWKLQSHSHSYSSSVTTQPTCTKTGVKTFTCYCGVSYTETIPATGHANDWGDNKCENCGEILFAEPTKILYPENNQIVKIATTVGNDKFLNYDLSTYNVQIYENLDENSNSSLVKTQYFKLIHVGDGWYIISNVENGRVVDVEGGIAASKTNIGLHGLHYGDNQVFRFYDAGDGYCYIKSKLGCYLDVAHGQNINNANVWAHAFNGNAAEKWKLVNHSHSYTASVTTQPTCTKEGVKTFSCICGESYTESISKIDHTNRWDDNKCDVCGTILIAEPTTIIYPDNNQTVKIESAAGSAETIFGSDGITTGSGKFLNADLWSDNIRIYENLDENDNLDLIKSQYFKLTHVGDGWYIIINVGTGKTLDVTDANPNTYTNLQQCDSYTNDAQLFRFYDAGDGYCFIKSKLGCFIDVEGGQNANSANVWMHTFNGATAQKWKLHTHPHVYTSSITTQPTCTKEGVKTFSCVCGDSYTESIDKKPHTIVVITAVSASCTKTGLSEGKKCSVCGTVTVAQQTTAKKAHTEVIDGAVASTCTKTGLTQGKHCSVCNTVTVAQQTVATVSHIDNNGDYRCDFNCGYEFDKPVEPTPEVPEEPDTPNKDCSCMCHKTGLIGIIWKILRFFYKIFKINPVCGCGVNHY